MQVAERFGIVGSRFAGFGLFDPMQQPVQLPLPGGRRHELTDVVIENDQARRVALQMREVDNGRSQEARVFDLMNLRRPVLHGPADIQKHIHLAISFAAIALQEHFFRARKYVPVDVAEVVAGRIHSVLGKFLAESEIG